MVISVVKMKILRLQECGMLFKPVSVVDPDLCITAMSRQQTGNTIARLSRSVALLLAPSFCVEW
jgi:hypothetical protein